MSGSPPLRPGTGPADARLNLADRSRGTYEREHAVSIMDEDPADLPQLIEVASDPAEDEGLQQRAATSIGTIWLNADKLETGDDTGFAPAAREEIALFREHKAARTLGQPLTVRMADYADPFDAGALFMLLDSYARSVNGGGKALPKSHRERLAPALAGVPGAFSLLALEGGTPIGVANCFMGFSTFACAPLVNVHDLAVVSVRRGCGVGTALLRAVEGEARSRGACKITLEVLSGNEGAKALYARHGFANYALADGLGNAQFWEKTL